MYVDFEGMALERMYPIFYSEYVIIVPYERCWSNRAIANLVKDRVFQISFVTGGLVAILWLPQFFVRTICSLNKKSLSAALFLLTTFITVIVTVVLYQSFVIGATTQPIQSIDALSQLSHLEVIFDTNLITIEWLHDLL